MPFRRSTAAVVGLMLFAAACSEAAGPQTLEIPEPIDASALPVGPRIPIENIVGLPEDAARAWAEESGWSKIEVVSDDFVELSSSPSERILLTVEDGVVVEAWAG